MSRVEPNRNVYVGHRYVPKIFGEWDKKNEYEGLSIVTYQGGSFTSKKYVPVGIDILNDDYWVATGNYNAQIEYYRKEVQDLIKSTDKEFSRITDRMEEDAVNVMDFGALGNGVNDDTLSIQKAIDYAKENGRKAVRLPGKVFLISDTILTNGISLIGSKGNIFSDNNGTIIRCNINNFTAISQGEAKEGDLQYYYTDIIVENAGVGFEINYVLNSKFEFLYAKDCKTAFKLGDPTSVGSMFNEFNNLYTRRCEKGIVSESNEYFNNNVFNNGYIQGEEFAASFKVNGGYGGVNNTFNNVEFRSPLGRGIIGYRMSNTVLNTCYLENGGSGVVSDVNGNFILNNCVYALFKNDNTNNDTDIIKTKTDSGNTVINGGVVYLSSQYEDVVLIGTTFASASNVEIIKEPRIINKNLSPTFKISNRKNNVHHTTNIMDRFIDLSFEDIELSPDVTHKVSEYIINSNSETISEDGDIIVTGGYWNVDFKGRFDLNGLTPNVYIYLRINGVNKISMLRSQTNEEHYNFSKTMKLNDGDKISISIMVEGSDNVTFRSGALGQYLTMKYLG